MEKLGDNSKLPPRQTPNFNPPPKKEGGSSLPPKQPGVPPKQPGVPPPQAKLPPRESVQKPQSVKPVGNQEVKLPKDKGQHSVPPTPPQAKLPPKQSLPAGEVVPPAPPKGVMPPPPPPQKQPPMPPKKMPERPQDEVLEKDEVEKRKRRKGKKKGQGGDEENPKTESDSVDSEEDIDELEKSYKVALSDKEKERKRKKRRLLILLLFLLLLIGSIIGTYFIIKSKEDQFIPEFNDNVNIRLSDYEILKKTNLSPADTLSLSNYIHIAVPDNTLEAYADIVAFAIKISFNYVENDEVAGNCNDKFYVLLDHADEIYGIEDFDSYTAPNGDKYYKVQQDQLIYYTRIMMPGSSMSLVKGFLVGPDEMQNDSAEKTIRITLTAWGVFPSIEKILDDPESYLKGAPREWAQTMQDQAKVIFDNRRLT